MSSQPGLRELYPFLHGKQQDPAKLNASLLYSIEEKARDSRDTNARFFSDQAPTLASFADDLSLLRL